MGELMRKIARRRDLMREDDTFESKRARNASLRRSVHIPRAAAAAFGRDPTAESTGHGADDADWP